MFFRQGLFSNESTNIFRQTVLYLYLELGKWVDIYPFCLLKFSLCYHPLLFTILIAGGDNFISQDLNVSTLKRDSRHNYKTLCLKIQVVYLKKTPCQRPPPKKKTYYTQSIGQGPQGLDQWFRALRAPKFLFSHFYLFPVNCLLKLLCVTRTQICL